MFFQKPNPVKRAGSYAVELRVPPGGVFAGEEIDIEFRVTDTSRIDPVDGPAPVVRAKIQGRVAMPSMPAMPSATPRIHTEGVPGDYGLVTLFPHGGDYQVTLRIEPPGGKPFTVSFDLDVSDPDPTRKSPPPPFTLEVQPQRAVAEKPTPLRARVRRRADKKIVTEFETVHEQKLHLILVREDLGSFFHEHPTLSPDGTFSMDFSFPTGGRWTLFADVAPKDSGSQVLFAQVHVSGGKPWSRFSLESEGPRASAEGHRLALRPQPLVAGKMLSLTLDLKDASGRPVDDYELWLGAKAHLILIEKDAKTFVHSHPDESDPKNGDSGRLTFLARFPRAGVYRGWLQLQRAGRLHTVPFTVKVGDR